MSHLSLTQEHAVSTTSKLTLEKLVNALGRAAANIDFKASFQLNDKGEIHD